MSEVLTALQCATTTATIPAPQTRGRPSLARKRPAAAGLRPLSELALAEPPRVPSSSLSTLSSASSDFSADYGDDDSHTDLLKRSRHDSGISILSDESDSQSAISNYSPDFSLGSSESQSSASSTNSSRSVFTHNCLIGEFRVVGTGRECKAFHEPSGEVYDARILCDSEIALVNRIVARLDEADRFYNRNDIEEMKNTILPAKVQIIEERSGRTVMFTPIFRKSLHSFAQERGVDVTEAELQPIFEQIIRLMAFCHSIGIILRDLKPRKLVFDHEGKVRLHHIRDCLVLDDPYNDTVYEKFGSPAYVQPEVLNGNGTGYSGKAADMWSLGVLMYLLLLGRYPFFDKTPIGVLQRIVQARVTMPVNCQISKYARVLLYSLLRKCPEKRPTAVQLLYIPWGMAKNLPSRGTSDRYMARRILDEIMNSQMEVTTPVSVESRPAVPMETETATVANSNPTPIDEEMRRAFATAQRLHNYQQQRGQAAISIRATLQEMFSSAVAQATVSS